MRNYQSGGWGGRVISTLLLIVGIAVGARVIYELLRPVLPVVLALVILGTAYLATTRQWRR